MIIKIFNTLSKKEEELSALEENHLKMYVCGPTVYDRPHIGNARAVVVYDLFYRFFLKQFKKVTYVRNITDVDDKINMRAKERKITINELTTEIINQFHHDTDALNVMRPTLEPRATDNIKEMIKMIEDLIKNKHAYESEGHVLFDVKSYKDYGELSNRSLDEMIAGARVEVAKYKKDPLDFVLWKPADNEDDKSSVFESPWGKGRPGWHIECSAMSSKYLGENFDIHGGGADLQFPHHENEIAQSKCANEGSLYAKYWIHNGFLTVNGEKMSKSLNNFITVNDLLTKGVKGIAIRYLLMQTHYRKPIDFSQKSLDDANKALEKFYNVFEENDLLDYRQIMDKNAFDNSELMKNIFEFLSDDLNSSKAFALLHEKTKEVKTDKNKKLEFIAALDFLGLLDDNYFVKVESGIDENYIIEQIELRRKAKVNKDFALADKIRNDLLAQNIVLEDVAGGKTNFKIIK